MNADINICGQPFINTSSLCQPRKCWGSISHYVRYVELIQDWFHKVLILDAMVAYILYNSSVCQYLKDALNILSIWYLFGKLSCPVTDTRELPTFDVIDDTRVGFNASDDKVGMMTALNHHNVNFVIATTFEATLDNEVGIMTTLEQQWQETLTQRTTNITLLWRHQDF